MKMNRVVGWSLAALSGFAALIAVAGIWDLVDSSRAWQLILTSIVFGSLVAGINQIAVTYFKPQI